MKKIIVISFLVLCALVISSCSTQISEAAYEEFVETLEDRGYTIQVEEDTEKIILAGEHKRLTINETDYLAVFLYKNNDEMEKDASRLSADGFTYSTEGRTISISWVSKPRFYKKDNMIVLYVGEDAELIHVYSELLDSPFIGGSSG